MLFFKPRSKPSKQEQMEVGREAQAILDNPLIQQFFLRAQEVLYDQWRQPVDYQGNVMSPEDREMIFMKLQGLEAFEQFFRKLITDGKMVEKELQDQ